jgi:hypothetical protein
MQIAKLHTRWENAITILEVLLSCLPRSPSPDHS